MIIINVCLLRLTVKESLYTHKNQEIHTYMHIGDTEKPKVCLVQMPPDTKN